MHWQVKTPCSSSFEVYSHKKKLDIWRHLSSGGGQVRMKTLPLLLSFKLRVEQIQQVVLKNTEKCSDLVQWNSNEMDTVFHAITLHGLLWHSNQDVKFTKKKKKKERIFAKSKRWFLFLFYVKRGNGRATLCKLLLFGEEKDKNHHKWKSHTHCNNFLVFFPSFVWCTLRLQLQNGFYHVKTLDRIFFLLWDRNYPNQL